MNKSESFKNELRNYLFYKEHLKELQEKLEVLEYDMANVKGVSFESHIPNTNTSLKEQKRLELIEKRHELLNEIDRVKKQIKYIDNALLKIDEKIRRIVIAIYIDGSTYQQVVNSNSIFWSTGGLHKIIEKELENKL